MNHVGEVFTMNSLKVVPFKAAKPQHHMKSETDIDKDIQVGVDIPL